MFYVCVVLPKTATCLLLCGLVFLVGVGLWGCRFNGGTLGSQSPVDLSIPRAGYTDPASSPG